MMSCSTAVERYAIERIPIIAGIFFFFSLMILVGIVFSFRLGLSKK